MPLSIIFNNLNINYSEFYKKSSIILLITIVIFFGRNTNRIINENKLYNYNPIKSYAFNYDKKFYNRYLDLIDKDRRGYKFINIFGKEIMIIRRIKKN